MQSDIKRENAYFSGNKRLLASSRFVQRNSWRSCEGPPWCRSWMWVVHNFNWWCPKKIYLVSVFCLITFVLSPLFILPLWASIKPTDVLKKCLYGDCVQIKILIITIKMIIIIIIIIMDPTYSKKILIHHNWRNIHSDWYFTFIFLINLYNFSRIWHYVGLFVQPYSVFLGIYIPLTVIYGIYLIM